MPGIFDPTKAWSTAGHPYSLLLNNVDLVRTTGTLGSRVGVPIESVSVSEVGANGAGSMTFLCEDPTRTYTFPARARVLFSEHSTTKSGVPLFGGYVQARRFTTMPGNLGLAVTVTCADYNSLLDVIVIPSLKYKSGHSDKALLQGVVARASRSSIINAHSSYVVQTATGLDAIDFGGMTLRGAIEAIADAAGTSPSYYIDPYGYLHYYSGSTESAMGAAPYVFSDAPTGGQLALSDLVVEYDDTQIANAVYIYGGNSTGSGWVRDEASIKTYGLVQMTYKAAQSRTAARRTNVGNSVLGRHKDPLVRGSFSYEGTETGFRVGQTVTITNAALGLSSATYPIRQIDRSYKGGGTIRRYEVSFGELPASGRRRAILGGGLIGSSGANGVSAATPAGTVAGTTGGAADPTSL